MHPHIRAQKATRSLQNAALHKSKCLLLQDTKAFPIPIVITMQHAIPLSNNKTRNKFTIPMKLFGVHESRETPSPCTEDFLVKMISFPIK
jgi:hypothetical protein